MQLCSFSFQKWLMPNFIETKHVTASQQLSMSKQLTSLVVRKPVRDFRPGLTQTMFYNR